jgi:hypothetical protein
MNALLLQRIDDTDKMGQRPPEPIEFPHHQRITRTENLKRITEPRTLDLTATDGIDEDFLASNLMEGVFLEGNVLILG